MNPRNPEGSAPVRRLVVACAQILLIGAIAAAQVASSIPPPPPGLAPSAQRDEAPAARSTPLAARTPSTAAVAPRSSTARPRFPFDLDADGVEDTITREMRWSIDQPARSAFIVNSGADGIPLQVVVGPEPNDLFGWLTVCLGDIDGDGAPDLAVAAPRAVNGGGSYGRIDIVSGATGAPISTLRTGERGFFGLGIVPVADADSDGAPDLVVGAMQPIPFAEDDGGPSDGSGGVAGDDAGVIGENLAPNTYYAYASWRLVSTLTGEVLAGADGEPDEAFLLPGETVAAFWLAAQVPGERVWLDAAAGDLNADGVVNGDDLRELIDAFGTSDGPGSRGDLNADGATDFRDLLIVLDQFGLTAKEVRARGVGAGLPVNSHGDLDDDPCRRTECFMDCNDCPFTLPIDGDETGGGGGGPLCPYNQPNCAVNCFEQPCQPGCPSAANCGCIPGCCQNNPCGGGCPLEGSPCCSNPCASGCPGAGSCPCQPGCCQATPCAAGCPGANSCQCDPCAEGCPEANSCECDPCGPNCPPSLNLTVDCNNDGETTEDDDGIEQEPAAMKVLVVNRGDADDDSIPDYADGFGMFGPDSDSGVPADRFARLNVNVRGAAGEPGMQFFLLYNDAPLADLVAEEVIVEDIESSYFRYHRGEGLLRIWRKPASAGRTEADFLPSGVGIPAEDIGCEDTLYIEAVNGSAVATTIIGVLVKSNGTGVGQIVRVLPFDGLTGLAEQEIEGFNILSGGSVLGTPENDIIFGTAGATEIHGGDGDDLIVCYAGDQSVYAGSGNDVVFASVIGEKEILLDDVDSPVLSLAAAREGIGQQRLQALENTILTRAGVERAYDLLFGENDPWLNYFEAARGRVRAVAYTFAPEGEIGAWSKRDALGEEGKQVTIIFGLHEGSTFETAAAVRRKILELASLGPDDKCGLRVQIEGAIGVDIVNSLPHRQLHPNSDLPITTYLALRQAAFDDALELVAFTAGLYIEAIRFASVGTDIVMTVAGLADGDFEEAIALLPLISSAVTGSAKLTFRVGSTEHLNKVDEFIRHFPCDSHGRTACSSIPGWAFERGVPRRSIRALNGEETIIVGRGHPATRLSERSRARSVLRSSRRSAGSRRNRGICDAEPNTRQVDRTRQSG